MAAAMMKAKARRMSPTMWMGMASTVKHSISGQRTKEFGVRPS
jgi:hypothetical protein